MPVPLRQVGRRSSPNPVPDPAIEARRKRPHCLIGEKLPDGGITFTFGFKFRPHGDYLIVQREFTSLNELQDAQ